MLENVPKGLESSSESIDDKVTWMNERAIVGHPEVGNSCGALTEVSSFLKTHTFEIPETGYSLTTFPESYSDYVTVSDNSDLTFSLSMNDGVLPSELWINPTTGVISLRNDASNKYTYSDLRITVTSTNGDILLIDGITVEKICGPNSTTITPSNTYLDTASNVFSFSNIDTVPK
jgi:hypothetical protein